MLCGTKRVSLQYLLTATLFVVCVAGCILLLFPFYLSYFSVALTPPQFRFVNTTANYTRARPSAFDSRATAGSSSIRTPTRLTTVLLQKAPTRSKGEFVRVHQPFRLSPNSFSPLEGEALIRNLNCSDFSKRFPVSPRICASFLAQQQLEHVSYFDVIARLKPVPARWLSHHSESPACTPKTAVLVPVHSRDINVCHFTMKLLLAYTVAMRSRYSASWLNVPPVNTVVLLTDSRKLRSAFDINRSNFHSGLLDALFRQHFIKVIVHPSLEKFASTTPCFRAAAVIGSFANKFAFPDVVLGPSYGYNLSDSRVTIRSSQPAPLSSDALALRAHVFHPNSPRPMRRKLLYVARSPGSRRTWIQSSEWSMREMLRTISKQEHVELAIFETRGKPKSFLEQIRYFEDAAVIVGFHGAGLALSVFAPRGAAVIEIEPDYHKLGLFYNVRSSGLRHDMLQISPGSTRVPFIASELFEKDRRRIRKLVLRRLRETVYL